MTDIFRPTSEPARTIYDAFQDEATKREQREPDEWMSAEIHRVWRTATAEAIKRQLRPPTLDDVQRAERSACGHVDYGSKWAYGVVAAMRREAMGR